MRILRWLVVAVALVLVYSYAWRVTEPDPIKLITSAPKANDILGRLLTPELLIDRTDVFTLTAAFPIPCGSAPAAVAPTSGPRVSSEPACVNERDTLTVIGAELGPNAEIAVRWRLPDGNPLPVEVVKADASGALRYSMSARPLAATRNGTPSLIELEVSAPTGERVVSQTVREVFDQLMVTLFIALLSTVIASVVAAPLSFLAARNITGGTILGRLVYFLSRSAFNLMRSYEPLVLATLFAVVVGFGKPFAGVLGLILTTIASLGKMFSEAVEDIDMGTVEAVTATGASRAQVIAAAVVPQIIPNWMAYMLYHWDINVRISTILGYVGAGGIGYYLSERISTLEYHKAGTAILFIVLVVWSLDFISAQVRKRLI